MQGTRAFRKQIKDQLQEAGLKLDPSACNVEFEDTYTFELHYSTEFYHEVCTDRARPEHAPSNAEVFSGRRAKKKAKARRNAVIKRARAFAGDPRAVLDHLGIEAECDSPGEYRRKLPRDPFAIGAPVVELAKCGQCRGKGVIKCPQCKGSGKVSAGTRQESEVRWELDHVPGHQGNTLWGRGLGGTPIAPRPVQKTRTVPVSKRCTTCSGSKRVKCPRCAGGARLAEVLSVVVDGRVKRTSNGVDDLPTSIRRHITDNWNTLDQDLDFEVMGARDSGRRLQTSYRGHLQTVRGSFVASNDLGRRYSFGARGVAGVATIIEAEAVLDECLADEIADLNGRAAAKALQYAQSRPLLRAIANRFTTPLSFLRRKRAPRFAGLLSPRRATAAARTVISKRLVVTAPVAIGGLAACAVVWGGVAAAMHAERVVLHAGAAVAVATAAPGMAWLLGRRLLRTQFPGSETGAEGAHLAGLLNSFWLTVGLPATVAATGGILMLAAPS